MRIAFLALACAVMAVGADIKGKWNLTATAPDGQEYKLDLDLRDAGGKLNGTLSSPEFNVDLQDVQLKGDQLSYSIPARGGYTMKLTVSGGSMKGTYAGSDGTTGPVVAVRPASPAGGSVAGKWKGTAKSPEGHDRELQLELAVDGSKVTGTLVVPEANLPIEEGRLEGDQLSFKLNTDEGTYSIRLTVTGDRMKGRYTGPSESGDITLAR